MRAWGNWLDPIDLKSIALCIPVRVRVPAPNKCAYSLMVKQWSHKPPSLGSIPSGRTKRLEQATLGINI